MANALITPSVIAKEALLQLENNLVFGNNVHREYKKEFAKVGSTVSIRKPVKFYAADGATRVNQDVEESNTSIVVDQQKHVSWAFSSVDLTLTIEEYSERYIKPASIALANTIDRSLSALYFNFWNHVGTPGTTPANFAAMALAAQRADEMAIPSDMRKAMLNPAAGYAIAATATALPNIGGGTESRAYREGEIGRIAGYETYSSQNVTSHTNGARGGTPLVNGATQNVTYATAKTGTNGNSQSLVTDGWSNSVTNVVRAGEVFTLAGVFAVNPVPGEGTTGKLVMPYLQQFTVLANADSNGSGQATLTISPAMITSGPYQTVSAAPADNAALTLVGTAATAYPQNLCIHKNAMALVTVPMELPDGVSFKARETYKGLSMRVVKQYDIDADTDIIRLDILYGRKTIYPDLGVRLTG
jgi:hypothetical protein